MKMTDVFDLPIPLSEIDDIHEVYNYSFLSADDYDVAIQCAHAINCHDELVDALDKMAALHRKTYGLDGAFDSELLAAEAAIKKARGEK